MECIVILYIDRGIYQNGPPRAYRISALKGKKDISIMKTHQKSRIPIFQVEFVNYLKNKPND